MIPGSFITVDEAAVRLGVVDRRVRAMIYGGVIEAEKAAGVWVISTQSLARILAQRQSGGRPFGPRGAWSLLLIASGEQVLWASPTTRWRARVAVREKGLEAALPKLLGRAARHAFCAHPSELPRLAERDDVMLGGVSAAASLRLGLQGGKEVEAYLPVGALEKVSEQHALDCGGEPNVLLRALSDELWSHLKRPLAPLAAVLADLSEHPDPRARRVAHDHASRLDLELLARA